VEEKKKIRLGPAGHILPSSCFFFFLNNSFSNGVDIGFAVEKQPFSLSFGTVHTVRKESRYERRRRRNMKKRNKK
jgi:hypothetical protein